MDLGDKGVDDVNDKHQQNKLNNIGQICAKMKP